MQLSHLNPAQREAVVSTEGPLLVLAGAGSGKTRVITHRIAHLMEQGTPARSILAVTFTNKAATEMKERVVKMVGGRGKGLLVSTFHAFGAELLREHIHHLGWPRKFAIADTGDQMAQVRRAMKERQVDDRTFDARRVLGAISRAKNGGYEPQPKPEGQGDDYDLIAHLVHPLYQRALKAQGAVDFDDLLVLPARLLREHPEVREKLIARFRYVLVDEFQDTNEAQLQLLKLLAGERQNVCAVGDDDQCIYSWRGAEVRNILEYHRHFASPREVRLEQNYRSTSLILEAANAVIAKNEDRKDKRMWTDQAGGERIRLVVAPNEEEEALAVGRAIVRALEEGIPADEIAVLYRVNGQARPIEEALRERNVPYVVVGGSEFFDRREVKDVLAYFKLLANPRDETALRRIINVPARGIGDVTMERLSAHAHANHRPLIDVLESAADFDDLPRGAAEKVSEFLALIERSRERFAKSGLADATRALLEEVGFAEDARSNIRSATVADRKLKAVEQILTSVGRHENREGPKADLLTYLNRLALDTRPEEDELPGRDRRVSLMTLHSSKGLEYRMVFLIGMEEDLLPHSGIQGEPQNLEEERRLCYVGLTRARERLVLSRAAVRIKRGRELPRTPSRFLEDIPPELIVLDDLEAPAREEPEAAGQTFFARLKGRLKEGTPTTPGRSGASASTGRSEGAKEG